MIGKFNAFLPDVEVDVEDPEASDEPRSLHLPGYDIKPVTVNSLDNSDGNEQSNSNYGKQDVAKQTYSKRGEAQRHPNNSLGELRWPMHRSYNDDAELVKPCPSRNRH